MPRIFVSFRKADERSSRDRVHRALVAAFGADQVFKSGESIPGGTEFAPVLLHQAAECEVMLVLIGPRWLGAAAENGDRLLSREQDWVRREIATALRAGNRVVPVLLGDATMLPSDTDLPADIARLGRSQFLRIEESRFEAGVQKLISTLTALLPGLKPAAVSGPRPRAAAPEPARQVARATSGGLALNIGGSVQAESLRIVAGEDQGE